MNNRRAAKTLKWMRKHVGPLVRETVLTGGSFIPEGSNMSAGVGGGVTTLVSPLAGAVVHAKQLNERSEEATVAARLATTSAGRMPKTTVYLVATPTRLVAVTVHAGTGRPRKVAAEYGLDEIDSITQAGSTLMQRVSKLQFTDGSHIVLNAPRGGGYYPQDFLPVFEDVLANFQK